MNSVTFALEIWIGYAELGSLGSISELLMMYVFSGSDVKCWSLVGVIVAASGFDL